MKDRVSIIIPCYNQAALLPETLDSVLAQTYQNWECLIINDGSPDNTEEVALKYCNSDERFKYFYKQNGGLSSARNAGIELSTGEFIKFLDSDDLLRPTSLQKSIQAFVDNDLLDVVYTDYEYYYEATKTKVNRSINIRLKKHIRKHFICGWDITVCIPIHCLLYKTKIIKDNEIRFNTLLSAKEDWDFHINIAEKTNHFEFLESVEAVYRVCDNSMSHNVTKMIQGEYRVVKEHLRSSGSTLFYWKWSLILCESILNIIKNIKPKPSNISEVVEDELKDSVRNKIMIYGWLLLPLALISRISSTVLNKTIRRIK